MRKVMERLIKSLISRLTKWLITTAENEKQIVDMYSTSQKFALKIILIMEILAYYIYS